MAKALEHQLSRRERQIMDVLFRRGGSTVAEVRDELADPPSYSSVRALLRILEDKGYVRHSEDGPRYVYAPTMEKDRAQRSALRHLRDTFFNGSAEGVMAALLDDSAEAVSGKQLDRLAALIERARAADKEDAR